jgi:hypothetical protein
MSFLQIEGRISYPQILLHYQSQLNNSGAQIVLNFEICGLEDFIKNIEGKDINIIEYPTKRDWHVIEATILAPDGYHCILSEPL